MGSWHPGSQDEDRLTNDEVVEILLAGVRRAA
jgi:hypothetical protein